MGKPRLISRLSLETKDQTPYTLSISIGYMFSKLLKDLRADMLSKPGQSYMLTIEEENDEPTGGQNE